MKNDSPLDIHILFLKAMEPRRSDRSTPKTVSWLAAALTFAAWLGVVPRQYSTGGKARLLGISKRGNVYLRKILVHGARAAVLRIKRDGWMRSMSEPPKNVVVVAMANKLARIAWAVLSSGEDYRPKSNMVTAS